MKLSFRRLADLDDRSGKLDRSLFSGRVCHENMESMASRILVGPERVTRALIREKDKLTLTQLQGFRPSHILVHYDEVALKGRNRGMFEKRLHRNIQTALENVGELRVHRVYGRLIVELGKTADVDLCARRLARVFGVTRFSPMVRFSSDLEPIKSWLGERLEGLASRTFAVSCRRANKNLPFTSLDVNRELGDYVRRVTGWKVQIDDPELTIHVHLIEKSAYVGLDRMAGEGGLPTGTAGKVVGLLSGGIDSPVAIHHMLRRGAEVVFVHFHSFPHTTNASQDKVREMAQILLPHGHRADLYMVPFAETQQRIVTECPAAVRVILYRRFMMRAAEVIAERHGCLATVTGDSLGQVASQTLENIHTINAVTHLPVLRPLIGNHKAHIVDEARRIDTYETSIEPHDDCCSFLMPQRPATQSTPKQLAAAEASLDVEAEVRKLVESSTVEKVTGE